VLVAKLDLEQEQADESGDRRDRIGGAGQSRREDGADFALAKRQNGGHAASACARQATGCYEAALVMGSEAA
jgi:hypothetical protein